MSGKTEIEYIDLEALRENCSGKNDLVLKLLNLFIQQGEEWLVGLDKSFLKKDEGEIRSICHRIKGGAGTLQARIVFDAAAELGVCAREDNLSGDEGEKLFLSLKSMIEKSSTYAVSLQETLSK